MFWMMFTLLACESKDNNNDSTNDDSNPSDVNQEESIDPHCEETLTDISSSEEVLGITIDQWLNTLPTEAYSHMDWYDESHQIDCLNYSFVPDEDSYQLVESVFVEGNSGIEIGISCFDSVRLTGTLVLDTEDDSFGAQLPVTINIIPEAGALPSEVFFSADLSENEAAAILDIDNWIDLSAYDQVWLNISGVIGADLVAEMVLLGEVQDAASVSLANVIVASIGMDSDGPSCE